MLLGSTTDKLRLQTSTAANLDVLVDYADMDDTTKAVTVDRQLTQISSATTTDVLAAPASGFSRKVKWLSISNKHASLSNLVTLIYQTTGGPTDYIVETGTLAPSERMSYTETHGMRFLDSEGREKLASLPRTSDDATVTQIASHSADTYYAGLPVTGRLQAGSWFRWTWRSSKGGGVAGPTYILRFGTAGTTADTARVTLTGAAQTAVADEAWFVVEAGFRTVGASAVLVANHMLVHRLATTGFSVTASNVFIAPVASSTFDSSVAGSILGLSVNPGASGAWVTDLVTVEGRKLLP
jgi:hypothetical protein